jgi:para-nitrobenzyl esterase
MARRWPRATWSSSRLTIAKALGFYASKELAAESPRGTSGNWGMLDMVASLQWVHRNVAKFGGDPDNVTIAGQSAGAQAVAMLQTSPLARGLMQRVFAMSSARPSPYVIHDTEEQVERRLAGFSTTLGVNSLAELRALPADRIVAAQLVFYEPNVDNNFFPEQSKATWEAGRQNDVPLMLSTRDEDTNDFVERARWRSTGGRAKNVWFERRRVPEAVSSLDRHGRRPRARRRARAVG